MQTRRTPVTRPILPAPFLPQLARLPRSRPLPPPRSRPRYPPQPRRERRQLQNRPLAQHPHLCPEQPPRPEQRPPPCLGQPLLLHLHCLNRLSAESYIGGNSHQHHPAPPCPHQRQAWQNRAKAPAEVVEGEIDRCSRPFGRHRLLT